MLEPDQVHAAIAREWDQFIEMLAGEEAPIRHHTRCAEWSIRDLAVHVHWGTSMEADGLQRRRTATPGPAEGTEPDPSATHDEIVDGVRRQRAWLVSELEQLGDAPDLASPVPLPYGNVPLGLALQIFTMEAGVHCSDLAAAVGVDDTLPADVAAATWPVLAAFMPHLAAAATDAPADGVSVRLAGATADLHLVRRAGGWVAQRGAGEATTTVTGDDSTVLLFALGRVPVTDPRLTVSGEQDHATRFKAYIPGF